MKQLRIFTSEQTESQLFARMLCLTLREQSYAVSIGGDPHDAALLLLDADALSAEQLQQLTHCSKSILYATRREALLGYPEAVSTFLRPFAMREFLSQLRQLTTEADALAPFTPPLHPADELLFSEQRISFRKTPLNLTAREAELLRYLYRHRGTPRSREDILRDVWHYNTNTSQTNVVDVYIRYLRAKIDQTFDVRLILSVRGKGYVIP